MKTLKHLALTLFVLFSSGIASARTEAVRAYVITFSYQNAINRPNKSHTAATFFLMQGDRLVDQVDISWLPASNYFIGASGAEVPPLRRVPGTNYALGDTVNFSNRLGEQLLRFGPYESSPQLFEMAKNQRRRLNSGDIDYKMLDGRTRPGATNCIHAVTDTVGFTSTGVLRGAEASAFVIDYFNRYGHLRSLTADNQLYEMVRAQLLRNRNED